MICQKCKNDSECLSASVFYAKVTMKKGAKIYSSINERKVFLCKDCIIKKNKKNALLLPFMSIAFPFLLGFLLRMSIGAGQITQIIIIISVIISAILLIFSLIQLFTKSYAKIHDIDVYNLASETLKKELQANSKVAYEFWSKYPKQFLT